MQELGMLQNGLLRPPPPPQPHPTPHGRDHQRARRAEETKRKAARHSVRAGEGETEKQRNRQGQRRCAVTHLQERAQALAPVDHELLVVLAGREFPNEAALLW